MRTIFLPLLAILAVPAAAADLQLVQPGDHAMSCAALGSEINPLAAAGAAPVAAAPRKKGLGGVAGAFGSAMPVLGAAVPTLGLLGGSGGAALLQAAGVASSVGAHGHTRDAVADARPDAEATALREARKQRLLAIFEDKGC